MPLHKRGDKERAENYITLNAQHNASLHGVKDICGDLEKEARERNRIKRYVTRKSGRI